MLDHEHHRTTVVSVLSVSVHPCPAMHRDSDLHLKVRLVTFISMLRCSMFMFQENSPCCYHTNKQIFPEVSTAIVSHTLSFPNSKQVLVAMQSCDSVRDCCHFLGHIRCTHDDIWLVLAHNCIILYFTTLLLSQDQQGLVARGYL